MRKMIQRKLRRITALLMIVTLFMGMNGVTVSAADPVEQDIVSEAESNAALTDLLQESDPAEFDPGEVQETDDEIPETESEPAEEGTEEEPEVAGEPEMPDEMPSDADADDAENTIESEELNAYGEDESDPDPDADPDEEYYESETLIPDIEDDGTWLNSYKLPGLSYAASAKLLRSAPLPAKYDARDDHAVSAVKDQAGWGACWAFQAVSAAESSVIMSGGAEPDLSELQLIEFAYNGPRKNGSPTDIQNIHSERGNTDGDITTVHNSSKVNIGGNGLTAMLAMSRWTGLGAESLDESMRYDIAKTSAAEMGAIPNEFAFQDQVHLTNGYMIPLSERDAVKKAIMDHGSCGIDIYKDDRYDSSYTAASKRQADSCCMFNYVQRPLNNHAVSVVGWDDDYPLENFADIPVNVEAVSKGEEPVLPEENGAWLIKNSYGTSYGDEGYVWISYENKSFQNTESAIRTVKVFEFENADNYDHIYQYDGTVGTKWSYAANHVAVRYHTGSAYEELSAAGIALQSRGVSYTISVYTNLTDPSKPQSGTLAHTQSGVTGYPGYHTIPLSTAVSLRPDSDYAIIWDLSLEGDQIPNVYGDRTYSEDDNPYRGYEAAVHLQETFYRKESPSWTDTGGRSTPVNFRLKAYTDDQDIIDLAVNKDDLSFEETTLYSVYGEKVLPEANIHLASIALRRDTDYTVTFYPADADPEETDPLEAVTDCGDYVMEITGIGAYKGTVLTPVHLLVVPRSLAAAAVTVVPQEYDPAGDYHPVSEVRLGGTLLQEGTDYSCEISVQDMTGTVTVTGMGNYSGSLSRTFTINGKISIAKVSVSSVPNYIYDGGRPIEPELLLRYRANARSPYKDLVRTQDYDLEYTDYINAGTAQITISGKGMYYGTRTVTFKIVPYAYGAGSYIKITYADLEGSVPIAQYTKSGAKPEMRITFEREVDGTPVVVEELTEGVDYTRTFANNQAVTTPQTRKMPSVTVKFKGNYKGTVPAQNFIIEDNNTLADEVKSVTVADKTAVKRAGAWKSVPEIIDKNGKKLTIGKDCLVYYYYTEETVLPDGTVREADSVVMPKDVVPSGTEIGLRISPLNYSGESLSYKKEPWKQPLVYRIVGRSVTRAAVRVNAKTYPAVMPEEGVQLSAADLKVTYGRNTLTCSEDGVNGDYEIVAGSYVNNKKAGTASVTIRGLNGYGGTKKVSFKIMPMPLQTGGITVTAADSPYVKGGVNAPVTVISNAGTEDEKILVEGMDYTVSYSNNKAVRDKDEQRPPTVKVKGKGNYKGTLTATFTITGQDLTEMLHTGGQSSAFAPDVKYSTKKNAWKSKPVLKDVNGKKLSASDFTVTDYVYAETTYIGSRKYPQGTSIDPVNGLEIGMKINAVIEGEGAYTGTCTCTYSIVR